MQASCTTVRTAAVTRPTLTIVPYSSGSSGVRAGDAEREALAFAHGACGLLDEQVDVRGHDVATPPIIIIGILLDTLAREICSRGQRDFHRHGGVAARIRPPLFAP